MEGNRKQVGGKGNSICLWILSGSKEKDGGRISFLISIPLGAQCQPPNLQEPVKNESVGHKTNMWDLLFKKYEAFQDRESRGGVPSECGALWTVEVIGQQSEIWVSWTHTLTTPRLWFSWKNDKLDKEKANMLQHRVLWVCLSTQVAGGRASSEDRVGGAQPDDSAANLLCAIDLL